MPVGRYIRIAAILLAGLIVAFAVAISATAATTPACASCHATTDDIVARTAQGPHAKVGCTACHVPSDAPGRISFASQQIFGMTLKVAPRDPTLAKVPDSRCLKCHALALDGTVSGNGLRFNHKTCAVGSSCTDCHSASAHGATKGWVRTPQMVDCLSCHSTKRVSEDCDLCHVKQEERTRLKIGGWRTTHGPQWKTTHGMGNLKTCSACHPSDYCTKCHGIALPHKPDYISGHGPEALAKSAECSSCHQKKACDSCHGVSMPHQRTFIKAHPAEVKRVGRPTCLKCHEKDDCDECHVRHTHPVTPEELKVGGR